MHENIEQLTLDFLTWLAAKPRTYAETMDAWRTSCPRLTVWENALDGGLIQVGSRTTRRNAAVTLTAKGQTLLEQSMKPSERLGRID